MEKNAVIQKRKQHLMQELGLSQKCIRSLHKTTHALCDRTKADLCIKNLRSLGFNDPLELIERNPTLLSRKVETIRARFYMLRVWMPIFDRSVDLYAILSARPQLWSVSKKKLLTILLLLLNVRKEVTPKRICNIITLNLENVLIAYMQNPELDCLDLHRLVRTGNYEMQRPIEFKKKYILDNQEYLPEDVFVVYKDFYCR